MYARELRAMQRVSAPYSGTVHYIGRLLRSSLRFTQFMEESRSCADKFFEMHEGARLRGKAEGASLRLRCWAPPLTIRQAGGAAKAKLGAVLARTEAYTHLLVYV